MIMKILNLNFRSRKAIISDESARRLTAEFLDGATEPAQERQLYDYYTSGHVADDLKAYIDMFAMYASLAPVPASVKSGKTSRVIWSVAASVAVIAAVGVALFFGGSYGRSDNDSLYAGSYIIRDGKKITDIKAIMPLLRSADDYVDSTMRQVDILYPDDYETVIIENALAGITDPQLKAELLANI